MSVNSAKGYYLGEDGRPRRNCAQAIADAFQDKFPVPAQEAARFSACGGGRAPEGRCGSLHVAKVLLEQYRPGKADECERQLALAAGSARCREIRTLGKLSCLGCVEMVAKFMETV